MSVILQGQYVTLTDGATVATDASLGELFYLLGGRTSRTMSNPTNPSTGQQITYLIRGVAVMTTSWGTDFILSGTWRDPSPDYGRAVTFFYNGTNWIEINRTGANLKLIAMPSDVSGLVAWYDAASVVLNDGDAVATWIARAGKNPVQATTAKQPVYKTNIQNGLPIVRFDGTDDYMSIVNPALGATALSVFAVFAKADTIAVLRAVVDVASTGVAGAVLWGSHDSGTSRASGQFGAGGVADYNTATSVGTAFHQWSWIVPSGTQPQLYKDAGSAIAPTNGGNGAVNVARANLYVGGMGGTQRFLYGDLAELIIYDSALSDPNRAIVATYLKNKWGTP